MSEVVVTAQRRPEPLGRVAAPVSVAKGQELRDRHATRVVDLEAFFPALTVQPTAAGNLVFLRGVGNFTLQPNSDPAVGFTYDGVIVGRPSGTTGDLFDIERVELLKGPQGVLYGRNAAAGSINVEPRQPVPGADETFAQLTLGSNGERRVEGVVNVPVGGRAALRLSGALTNSGPYSNGYDANERQQSVRAQLKIIATTRVTVRLATDYSHSGGVGLGSRYVGKYAFVPTEGRYMFVRSDLPPSDGIYTPGSQAFRQSIFLPGVGRKLDALAATPGQDNEIAGVHLHVEADLGFAKLIVLPAWRRVSLGLVNAASPFGYRIDEEDEQKSVEARLSGRSGPLEWIGGTLFLNEKIDSRTATNLSSSLILSNQRYRTHSRALFANGQFHLSDATSLSAGFRWTDDDKSFSGQSDSLMIICTVRVAGVPSCPLVPLFPLAGSFADQPLPVPAANAPPAPIVSGGSKTGAIVVRGLSGGSGSFSKGALDWRLAGELRLDPRSLLYATAETGHRPGGFNIATGFETFGPERLTALNLGFRLRRNELLQLNAEAFWWRYKDQQVSALRPDLSSPARNANITANIGNSTIRGMEVDARLKPWRGAHLRAVVQYLNARYRSFRYLQANLGTPPLTGCATAVDAATNLYTIDCTDKQPFNSPKWSLILSGGQEVRVGRLVASGEVATRYRSSRNIGFALLPEQNVGPTWTTDLRAAVSALDRRWTFAAFVQNLENRRTPEFMIYHPVSNLLIASTSRPRRIGVSFSVNR